LEEIIAKAVLIRPKSTNGEVKLGSKVTVKVKNQEHTYELVGEWEADPLEKKISHTSPLGKALIGKKKGEKVSIEAPAGQVSYHIQKIH
jgi:transcription elongation factor GreA